MNTADIPAVVFGSLQPNSRIIGERNIPLQHQLCHLETDHKTNNYRYMKGWSFVDFNRRKRIFGRI